MSQEQKRENYYNPPACWQHAALVENYLRLAKTYKVQSPLSFPEDQGLRFRQHIDTLNRLSDRIKENDAAAISICIDFVITPVMFCYSGYIRARMAARLKAAVLSETQKHHIRKGLLKIFESGDYNFEYNQFVKLLNHIGLGDCEDDYRASLCTGYGMKFVVAKALGLSDSN
ncbi:MAG: hypothetical protein KJ017_10320 [Alphaproteobacteria bacterium]|nr:hypothetical protein [Alphaproteobacteria bacterium]